MTLKSSKTVRVIDSAFNRLEIGIVDKKGKAYAVLWPGNGAHYRTVNIIELGVAGRTIDLSHAHECVYYIESGGGCIRDLEINQTHDLIDGSMIHIAPCDRYRLEAGSSGMKAIGGCVPVDPDLYEMIIGGATS